MVVQLLGGRHDGLHTPKLCEALEARAPEHIPDAGVGALCDEVLPELVVLVREREVQARVPALVLVVDVAVAAQRLLGELLVVVLTRHDQHRVALHVLRVHVHAPIEQPQHVSHALMPRLTQQELNIPSIRLRQVLRTPRLPPVPQRRARRVGPAHVQRHEQPPGVGRLHPVRGRAPILWRRVRGIIEEARGDGASGRHCPVEAEPWDWHGAWEPAVRLGRAPVAVRGHAGVGRRRDPRERARHDDALDREAPHGEVRLAQGLDLELVPAPDLDDHAQLLPRLVAPPREHPHGAAPDAHLLHMV
mmetsp:Transcript_14348/g.35042  ORF Transcript_14348/g.35042 Transcript_14348/m.35042 type:complete len:304 (-) Transcript_14348:266-1177(-)